MQCFFSAPPRTNPEQAKEDIKELEVTSTHFHNRQISIESTASLTDSGVPTSTTNTPTTDIGTTLRQGFRPLSK